MDIILVLESIVPQAEFRGAVVDNTRQCYDAVDWLDSRPKPTWDQLEAAWPAVRDRWAWAAVRSERDQRLTASDWTQLSDSPLTHEIKSLWAVYRQALRDIPQVAASPEAVVWPEAPAEAS